MELGNAQGWIYKSIVIHSEEELLTGHTDSLYMINFRENYSKQVFKLRSGVSFISNILADDVMKLYWVVV